MEITINIPERTDADTQKAAKNAAQIAAEQVVAGELTDVLDFTPTPEDIKRVEQGIADMEAGRTKPAAESFADIRARLEKRWDEQGLPSSSKEERPPQ